MKPGTSNNRRSLYLHALFALTLFLSPVMIMAIHLNGTTALSIITDIKPAWILDKTVDNVEFYHAMIICDGNKTVFLKFNNRNNYPVKISWKEVYGTKADQKKDGFAGKKEMLLRPGITMPQNCADEANKKIILLPSQVNPAAVTEIVDFSFKEITVNTL